MAKEACWVGDTRGPISRMRTSVLVEDRYEVLGGPSSAVDQLVYYIDDPADMPSIVEAGRFLQQLTGETLRSQGPLWALSSGNAPGGRRARLRALG